MDQPQLIPLIRSRLIHHLNGYLLVPELGRDLDQFIIQPGLGNRSGVLGALALGRLTLDPTPNSQP